jgi:hypothetical protein
MVRISIDVRLKARKDFYFKPELETPAIDNSLYGYDPLNMKDLTDLSDYQVKYCNILKIIVLNIS